MINNINANYWLLRFRGAVIKAAADQRKVSVRDWLKPSLGLSSRNRIPLIWWLAVPQALPLTTMIFAKQDHHWILIGKFLILHECRIILGPNLQCEVSKTELLSLWKSISNKTRGTSHDLKIAIDFQTLIAYAKRMWSIMRHAIGIPKIS